MELNWFSNVKSQVFPRAPGGNRVLQVLLVMLLGAALGAAQDIRISGVVRDSTGAGLGGARVAIEMAEVSTHAGTDGTFVLEQAIPADPIGFPAVIVVTREGQLDHRDLITGPVVDGMDIRMIPNAGDVTDVDGNVYQSVRIGNQVWTVANLKTTRFNDGTAIPEVTDLSQWNRLTTPARCWYGQDRAANHEIHGIIYNWYAVDTGKLAPVGWHVPSEADWLALSLFLMHNGFNAGASSDGNCVAKALAARTGWIEVPSAPGRSICANPGANNATGFTGLPGGWLKDGIFERRGLVASWWGATEGLPGTADEHSLRSASIYLHQNYHRKQCGHYVRLVRD